MKLILANPDARGFAPRRWIRTAREVDREFSGAGERRAGAIHLAAGKLASV
jgi:hypothetical protein